MKPFVLNTEATSLEQELQVIAWFKDNFPKSKKKVGSLARYLHPLVPEFIQKSICEVLASVDLKDPLETLRLYIKSMEEVPQEIERLKAEGNHGMIIDNMDMWGFSLITNQKWLSNKDKTEWTAEQEEEIAREALEAWMDKNNIADFNGKVVLFDDFGFSGVSMVIPTKAKPEHRALMAERRKHQKIVNEIAKYAKYI